jgi:predicted RNase H-like HicB family nuclease
MVVSGGKSRPLPIQPGIAIVDVGVKPMESVHMMPVEVRFKPSGGHWLGLCPSLDLTTQGESFEQAQENLREMLWLFIESCVRRGVLEEVLREAGFTKSKINMVKEAAEGYDLAPPAAVEAACRA